MRRPLILLVIGCLLLGAAPAHARYGRTNVRTWVRSGDSIAGRRGADGPLRIGVPTGSSRRVAWSVYNPGNVIPTIHEVTFRGCDDSNGFRFRYLRRDGKDITWPVTHAGYAATAQPRERAKIAIVLRSVQGGASYTCALSGAGNGRADTVRIEVHS
jgi:hypothetical protein